MDKIILENISIYAYHGCFKEETKIGTYFNIDLEITADLSKAKNSDNITDTINYQKVFDIIKKEMRKPSKIIEHVGQRCINALKVEFKEINSLKIKLAKMNPSLGGKVGIVSVELNDTINN